MVGRQWIIGAALVAIGALSIALAPVAAHADNGPHAWFGATPDECALCHRVHRGHNEALLVDAVAALCLTCHDGSGADTDVTDGRFLGDGSGSLKGGGFTYATMDTDWDNASAPAPISSSHIIDASSGTAWGNGAIGSGAGAEDFRLTCVSCHDPHGRAGTLGTATYRILRPVPSDSGAPTGVDVPDEDTKDYVVSSAANQYFGQPYGARRDPLSAWCAGCHTRYEAPPLSARTHSGDSIFSYRHMTEGESDYLTGGSSDCHSCHVGGSGDPCLLCHNIHDPGSEPAEPQHNPRCQTCHVAHGTTAGMGTASGAVEWPDGSTTPSGDERSSLLRLDNRGVCQPCHEK